MIDNEAFADHNGNTSINGDYCEKKRTKHIVRLDVTLCEDENQCFLQVSFFLFY